MPPILPFRRTRIAASKFEDLLRPHVEHLYRLAWRFTGNVADAEDLVQDVLLKLYPRTRQLSAIERLRPWLVRVLYHHYVDSVRLKARSPSVGPAPSSEEDGDPLDELPSVQDGPEEHAERGERHQQILQALDQLNPDQRAVVSMHDIEGYSLEELETILETPLGTLKSRLHRARSRLRELLVMEPFSGGERV
jgi:RNA polymerase sigma factor (sigma-70 family)